MPIIQECHQALCSFFPICPFCFHGFVLPSDFLLFCCAHSSLFCNHGLLLCTPPSAPTMTIVFQPPRKGSLWQKDGTNSYCRTRLLYILYLTLYDPRDSLVRLERAGGIPGDHDGRPQQSFLGTLWGGGHGITHTQTYKRVGVRIYVNSHA